MTLNICHYERLLSHYTVIRSVVIIKILIVATSVFICKIPFLCHVKLNPMKTHLVALKLVHKIFSEYISRRHFDVFINMLVFFLESRETELWDTGGKDQKPKDSFCRYIFGLQ